MERRSLIKTLAALFVGVWTLKPSLVSSAPKPTFEPLYEPTANDALLMDYMRRLYARHVEFCALRGREPIMRDPEQLFEVVANLRTLHDLDAMSEMHHAWVQQLRRCHDMILAAEG